MQYLCVGKVQTLFAWQSSLVWTPLLSRRTLQTKQTTMKYKRKTHFFIHRTMLELNSRTSSPLSASLIFWRHCAIGSQTLPSPFVFSYNEKYSSPACFTTAILRNVEKHWGMMFWDKNITPSISCSDFSTNTHHYAPYSCSEKLRFKSSFWRATCCLHIILALIYAIRNSLKLNIWNRFERLCTHINPRLMSVRLKFGL